MISTFKDQFADRYQDTFHKTLVARMIANYRLESDLEDGQTVSRFALDMSAVQVRTITPLVDREIDPITNSKETLTIDQYKGTTFPISRFEKTLHKNPDLGLLYGKEAGILVAEYVDATILAEVRNAQAGNTFDTGDLTTTVSNGTPIALSTTNVVQMVTQAKAKLNTKRVRGGNKAWVLDDYAISVLTQHVIGRDTSMSDSFYTNGRSGDVLGDQVLVSDNLTGEAEIAMATNATAGQVFVVGGVTFTIVASPAAAGDVDLGGDVDATRANLAAAINGGAGAGSTYIELSAADRATLNALRVTATNDDSADTLTLVGIGAGRSMSPSTDIASASVTSHFVNSYYGKKGAIDAVIQEEVDMMMTQEAKQDTKNIFNDVIFGVKTFADGARKMLQVKIAA